MKFFSLNQNSPTVDFRQALLAGLAPDGGLYFPESFPQFSQKEISDLKNNSLPEAGFKVLSKWLEGEMDSSEIKEIADKALNFPIPLRKVGDFFILELFHGPTMAFKDIAARSLALLMSRVLQKENKKAVILVATSGDTGGAVAHGFANVPNIKVVALYPKGKVSRLQEEQLTRVSENVFSIEVDGVFDDCQALVKKALVDSELKNLNLSSANSISVGRLIPQIIYYVYTYAQMPMDTLEFVVPCGNFGNVCAGIFAKKMGLPFNKFLVANNENDEVYKYYQTGVFQAQQTVQTLSTAMDIGNPSNFARILKVFDNNHAAFKELIKVVEVTDLETAAAIKKVYTEQNYLLDPHTAVAWVAAEDGKNDFTKIITSTASPIKFADSIKEYAGIEVDDSQAIVDLAKNPKRKIEIKNDYAELKSMLLSLPI
ncbi:MAG: threonine synthase [Candidatus Tagabacteria bacterium CG09_land_8_20_14_0_10_41_14]|uniref:Threonine synthase n=1 Tax=Candidatus Tagabacteria bacterium CG09_land_8_20_14_0_10_41_14 TaxID=1975021 RepID=A0A2H0WLN5_9BACT|nr:MAG: threonine synthase [Candidatus Tagabacteria bacterium CG09_land_8_20_14_0_10_41_14]